MENTRSSPLQCCRYASQEAGQLRRRWGAGGEPMNLLAANQPASLWSLSSPFLLHRRPASQGGESDWQSGYCSDDLITIITGVIYISIHQSGYRHFINDLGRQKAPKTGTLFVPGTFRLSGKCLRRERRDGGGTREQRLLLDSSFETTGLKQLDASDLSAAWRGGWRRCFQPPGEERGPARQTY